MDDIATPREPSPASETPTCYRHPDRETRLRCSECDRPICVQCSHDSAVGQRCPECARPEGRHRVVRVRSTRQGGFAGSPVVYTLIALNVLLYLAVPPDSIRQIDWFVLGLGRLGGELIGIEAGEWWRIATGTFLHGGLTHILFNMYALYILGPQLERQVGGPAFAGAYLAAGIMGALASVIFEPHIPSVGASGSIFGLFGIWLWASWRLRHTPAGRAQLNQFGILLAINLALPLFVPRIDWRGHVGGLVAGIVIAILWAQLAAGKRNAAVVRTVIAFGFVALGLGAAIAL